MKKQLKLIDLFAGVWWLSYGFAHMIEFAIIAANEILPKMAKTYELNHPWVHVYCKDIRNLNVTEIKKDLSIKQENIDIIVWWPPCQAYSTVGKRIIDDPRGKLFQEYYRILKEANPKFFIFENVKWLLSMQWWQLLQTIIQLFESLWYSVQYKVLNAADFWTPQIRERVIIVWTKLKIPFQYPEPTHYNPIDNTSKKIWMIPYVTLQEAIGDLEYIPSWWSSEKYLSEPKTEYQKYMRKNSTNTVLEHNSAKNNPKLIALMGALPDGGTPADIEESLRPSSWFANTYCKLWWNRPATTITRNLGTPSSSRCIHPIASRWLTTREWARLQGFPDDYIFFWSRSEKNLQIGNAVPTFLSQALAKAVLKHFKENNINI